MPTVKMLEMKYAVEKENLRGRELLSTFLGKKLGVPPLCPTIMELLHKPQSI